MMRHGIIPLAIIFFSFQLALAKEFKKKYPIPAGSQIAIENSLGNIKVIGYKGKEIELTATMKSPGSDSIVIDDEHFGENIRIFARDTQFASPKEFGPLRKFPSPKEFGPPRGFGSSEEPPPPRPSVPPKAPPFPSMAMTPGEKVDFEVRIPQTIEYKNVRISALSGKIEVSNVSGRFWIASQRGNVEIKDARGWMTASSTSGNITVYLERASEHNSMTFSSISGSVEVYAPPNLDASVEMRSLSGVLKTDFPIDIKEYRYGMGKYAIGKVGDGLQNLSIRSNSGRVSLLRK